MNPMWMVIAMQIACIGFIFLETWIPSGGILGIIATASLIYSWILILDFNDSTLLVVFAIGDAILIPTTIIYAFRALKHSPLSNGAELNAQEGFQHNLHIDPNLVGKTGKTLSQLRPSGTADFGEGPIEVLAQDGMIDAETSVQIISVQENKIFVKIYQTKENT